MSTRAERRIQDFQRTANQDLKDDAAQAAANQQATNAPTPPQRVVVLDGTRGRLGGSGLALVGGWTEIARFVNKQSKPITIQSNVGTMMIVTSPGPPPIYSPVPPFTSTLFPRVNLRIQVGSGNEGGGSTTGTYYMVAGDSFETAGTFIVVSAQIFPDEVVGNLGPLYGATPLNFIDPTTVAQVSVSIAHGSPSSVERPTKWIQPQYPLNGGADNSYGEQSYVGPGRVKQVYGFCANGTLTNIFYLMFFDAVITPTPFIPPNFSVPLFTIPMQGGSAPFSLDHIESSRSFQQGLGWCISTAGGTLVAGTGLGTGYTKVEIELFAGAQGT
jgi:hypothetical protein